MKRPILNKHISLADFREFYWLKEELVAFCKELKIPSNASKIELTNRIVSFLENGYYQEVKKNILTPKSTFDWSSNTLLPSTLITDNYKNTENVRLFFEEQIGKKFHFSVIFMNWMKGNVGKTLADACEEWKRQLEAKKTVKTEIAPQFEYNRYMRDFLADNPTLGSKDAMNFWKLKRALRGTNEYQKSDLDLK